MTYWKTAPEFQKDLQRVDERLTSVLGRQPNNTERCDAMHCNRATLYRWLDKLEAYEQAQGTHLMAVGE